MSPNRFPYLRYIIALSLLIALTIPQLSKAAGVTVITHGFNGNAQGWVLGMAERIDNYERFRGTNVLCYEVRAQFTGGFVVNATKLAGGPALIDSDTEIAIKLDWSSLAGFFSQYDTYEVAAAFVPAFMDKDLIPELGGRALAELPLHLVGHSRGGSLVCQMSLLFGREGIWVDQVTNLDPHPVNEDGNSDPLSVSDAPLRIYDNVLYADTYFQDFGGYPHGQPIPGSYNRQITDLPGGYGSAHSDTHMWYHATIDDRSPANDTETTLSSSDRAIWFSPEEDGGQSTGFHFSRIGNGNRLSKELAGTTGFSLPFDGFNRRWDLGAEGNNNRVALGSNNGNWPSLIALEHSDSVEGAEITYQFARPASEQSTIELFLDNDQNPWNGNAYHLDTISAPGTGAGGIGNITGSLDPASSSIQPGVYFLLGSIEANGNSRYFYAPDAIEVVASPTLSLNRQNSSELILTVAGSIGQRIALDSTTDFQLWTPLATNELSGPTWEFPLNALPDDSQYFRARLAP